MRYRQVDIEDRQIFICSDKGRQVKIQVKRYKQREIQIDEIQVGRYRNRRKQRIGRYLFVAIKVGRERYGQVKRYKQRDVRRQRQSGQRRRNDKVIEIFRYCNIERKSKKSKRENEHKETMYNDYFLYLLDTHFVSSLCEENRQTILETKYHEMNS